MLGCAKKDDDQQAGTIGLDFESLIKSEFRKALSSGPPPPTEGFGIALSGDFSAMMKQAPVLDPEAPGFHEGNAYFWFEEFAKLYTVGLDLTSPDFQRLMQNLSAAAKDQSKDGLTNLKEIIVSLRSFKPRNRHDEFAKQFTLVWFTDWVRLGEIAIEVEGINRLLRNKPSRTDLEATATKLRLNANEVRLMIYRPSGSPQDVPMRLAMWRSLRIAASKVEAAVPHK
jgi:hypothetical protein